MQQSQHKRLQRGTQSACKNNSPNRSSPRSRSNPQLDGERPTLFKQFRARSTHQTDVCFTCGRWAPIFSRWRQTSRRANPCIRRSAMLFFEASRSPTDPLLLTSSCAHRLLTSRCFIRPAPARCTIPRTALDPHQLERFASNFTSPDSVHHPPRRGPLEPPGSASPDETPRTSEIAWQSRSHGLPSGLPVRKCSSALSCHRPSRCLSRLSPRSPQPAATGSVRMLDAIEDTCTPFLPGPRLQLGALPLIR